jgi:uncharacterized protein with WD repeat
LAPHSSQSLIDKKRKAEAAKKQKELDDANRLMAEAAAEKDQSSKEELGRAKRQMLYRKGLIRDFHAAMANSKMIKDIEDQQERISKGREGEKDSPPFLNKVCMKKMMAVNCRPEYAAKGKKSTRPINQV